MAAEAYAANVDIVHFGNYAFCATVSNPLNLPPGFTTVDYNPQEVDGYWDGTADAFVGVAIGGSWCSYLLSWEQIAFVNGPVD